jgi:hypothetical protein
MARRSRPCRRRSGANSISCGTAPSSDSSVGRVPAAIGQAGEAVFTLRTEVSPHTFASNSTFAEHTVLPVIYVVVSVTPRYW